ncbi:unnamed protein product [Mesocestoides corti]|uniref:MalT-like TPR region domain-containing protein n=1 Tax=Mesocestoides corti TaxID=53468 RepID=A0A0R3UJ31_MESCO|nr:unnamed protein product [Mesocestoides corti]
MVHLSNGSVNDTLLLAEVLFNSGQYHRTIALLSNNDTVRVKSLFYFMVAVAGGKATQQDRRFGPAWLALGHAYAADSEHDQAIAAYCTAAQIVRHSHVPMMYIGVEYSSSGNHSLAERFMQHALQRSPSDPAILHELGSLALNLKRYNKALKLLKQAYVNISQLSGQVLAPYWEPLLNNLGHAYRELGNYEEALKMHSAALGLVENSPTTLESIGLIYAQMGRYEEAIRAFQTALALHPSLSDTALATEMLDICMREYARSLEPPAASSATAVKPPPLGRGGLLLLLLLFGGPSLICRGE